MRQNYAQTSHAQYRQESTPVNGLFLGDQYIDLNLFMANFFTAVAGSLIQGPRTQSDWSNANLVRKQTQGTSRSTVTRRKRGRPVASSGGQVIRGPGRPRLVAA